VCEADFSIALAAIVFYLVLMVRLRYITLRERFFLPISLYDSILMSVHHFPSPELDSVNPFHRRKSGLPDTL